MITVMSAVKWSGSWKVNLASELLTYVSGLGPTLHQILFDLEMKTGLSRVRVTLKSTSELWGISLIEQLLDFYELAMAQAITRIGLQSILSAMM